MKPTLLIIGIALSLNSFSQVQLTTADSTVLVENTANLENIYSPSWDVIDEVAANCDPLFYDPFVPQLYSWTVSAEMITNDQDYVVMNDTSRTDTAFTLIKDENGALFTKYYPNGQIIQQGYLTIIQQENMRYDFSEVGSSNATYLREWVDSIYVGKPVAVGEWKYYYDNGNLASQGEHINTVKIKVTPILGLDMNTYYEVTIYDFTISYKVGEWDFFDQSGRLVISQQFENGKLVGMACMPEE